MIQLATMVNPDLVDYIHKTLALGFKKEAVIDTLLKSGWKEADIVMAFSSIETQPTPPLPPPAQMASSESASAISQMPEVSGAALSEEVGLRRPDTNPPREVGVPARTIMPHSDYLIANTRMTVTSTTPAAQVKQHGIIRSMFNFLRTLVLLLLFAGVGLAAYAYVKNPELFQNVNLQTIENFTNTVHLPHIPIPNVPGLSFLQHLGTSGGAPYTQDNLLSGILGATSKITSNSYKISAALAVVARDPDAVPFIVQVTDQTGRKQEYADDAARMAAMSTILSYLARTTPYPSSLQSIAAALANTNVYPGATKFSSLDPVSKRPYSYAVTKGGKDFALTVTFETTDAVRIARSPSQFASSTVSVVGQTVTFSKASYPYGLFMSPEPPQPFLAQLDEMARFLPAQLSASLSASASTDWSKNTGEWTSNVDATGDFGDLSYKIDIDVLKKDEDYYFRVNNFPSIFGGFLDAIKGEWVEVSPSTTASKTGSSNELSFVAQELPKAEAQYKENRAEFVDFMRHVATLADEEHLFTIQGEPSKHSTNGKDLYHYDLKVRKDAILPFYQKMVALAGTYKSLSDDGLFQDQGTIEYLQSPEFSQVFDYLDTNTSISVDVDSDGYPEIFSYTMRIVPPDTALQLKNKQAQLTFEADLTDINVPVNITAPAGAKPIEDVIKQAQANASETY